MPTLKDTARLFGGPLGIRSLSLTGLFILACFYTLYFASAVLFPVTRSPWSSCFYSLP